MGHTLVSCSLIAVSGVRRILRDHQDQYCGYVILLEVIRRALVIYMHSLCAVI